MRKVNRMRMKIVNIDITNYWINIQNMLIWKLIDR